MNKVDDRRRERRKGKMMETAREGEGSKGNIKSCREEGGGLERGGG